MREVARHWKAGLNIAFLVVADFLWRVVPVAMLMLLYPTFHVRALVSVSMLVGHTVIACIWSPEPTDDDLHQSLLSVITAITALFSLTFWLFQILSWGGDSLMWSRITGIGVDFVFRLVANGIILLCLLADKSAWDDSGLGGWHVAWIVGLILHPIALYGIINENLEVREGKPKCEDDVIYSKTVRVRADEDDAAQLLLLVRTA